MKKTFRTCVHDMKWESYLNEDMVQDRIMSAVKSYPKVEREKFERGIEADPTANKSYFTWIAKQIANGSIIIPEDIEKIKEALQTFKKACDSKKLTGRDRDILSYASYSSLYDKLKSVKGAVEEEEWKQQRIQKGTETVYDSPPWKVIKITTPDACVKLTKGAGWCVQYLDTADEYLRLGALFLILHNGHRYALAHEHTGSLKGISNEHLPLDFDDAETMYKILKHVGFKYFLDDMLLIKNMAEAPDEVKASVKKLLASHADKEWSAIKIKSKDEAEKLFLGTKWDDTTIPVYLILHNGKRYAMVNEHYGRIIPIGADYFGEFDAGRNAREIYLALRDAGVSDFHASDLAKLKFTAVSPEEYRDLLLGMVLRKIKSVAINIKDSLRYDVLLFQNHEMISSEDDYFGHFIRSSKSDKTDKTSYLYYVIAREIDKVSGLSDMRVDRIRVSGMQRSTSRIVRRGIPPEETMKYTLLMRNIFQWAHSYLAAIDHGNQTYYADEDFKKATADATKEDQQWAHTISKRVEKAIVPIADHFRKTGEVIK